MSLVRKNIAVNLIGSGWVGLVSIAFIPLYIRFMGVEAYGVVGFYITLQSLFALMDMGLTATVSRELARLSVSHSNQQKMRNIVRTLELIYWVISLLIMAIISFLAPWIASGWLNASSLPVDTIENAIVLMGIMIALRMPYGFYSGGLVGLQRQGLLNVIKVIVETLKSAGVVLVLWMVSPTIEVFFQWQLLTGALGVILMSVALWRSLPGSERASFDKSLLYGIWRFAAGMSASAMLSVVLVQADKVILSKMLSLQEFGYYMLASTVAMGLYVIVGPVFAAIYPRFSQLVSSGNEKYLIQLYHKSSQFMTVLVMPIAIVCCTFSNELLLLWTQDGAVADRAAPILSLLVIGTALNGMMNVPYALQLANGWTKLVVYMNIVALIVLIPALFVAVNTLGAIGGAMIWLALNAGYILFGLVFMHRKILVNEMPRWLISDFGVPVALSGAIILFGYWLIPDVVMQWQRIIWITVTAVVSVVAAFIAAPLVRKSAVDWIHRGF